MNVDIVGIDPSKPPFPLFFRQYNELTKTYLDIRDVICVVDCSANELADKNTVRESAISISSTSYK